MNFKKLLALLLALAMLLCCFAACDSSDKDDDDEDEKVEDEEKDEDEDEDEDEDKDDEDKDDEDDDDKSSKDDEDDDDDKVVNRPSTSEDDIIGKWVVRVPFMDILDLAEIDMGLDDFESDAEVYISIEFDDDETAILSVDMLDCVDVFCEDYIDYLKDGGIEEIIEDQGYTYDQYEQMLDQSGMTWDDFYDAIADSMDTQLESVDLTMVESGDYTFDGEIIDFEGVEIEVEIDGDEMEILDIDEEAGNIGIVIDGRTFDKVA